MWKNPRALALAAALLVPACAFAQAPAAPAGYDASWAKSVGGGDNGMRSYVFVLLTTGPKRMPDGPERNKMFEGHMANIGRLAAEKKLVLAGPMDGVDGWRGMFVFASSDIEEVKKLVATDPVIIQGEMVAQYHRYYASTGLMAINEIHTAITKK